MSRAISAAFLLLFLSFMAPTFAAAQISSPTQAKKQQESSAPVLNVTTRLVYVDVVVRDGQGQLVRNLTQQDFKIEEDGRTQKIGFFTARGEGLTAAATAAPAAPGEFSNVPAQNSAAVN